MRLPEKFRLSYPSSEQSHSFLRPPSFRESLLWILGTVGPLVAVWELYTASTNTKLRSEVLPSSPASRVYPTPTSIPQVRTSSNLQPYTIHFPAHEISPGQ